jgi:hypothetical protein
MAVTAVLIGAAAGLLGLAFAFASILKGNR